MSFCLIILAAGNSHRFRSNIGKPYQKIAGKSLIEINIDKARKIKAVKKIVLVYNKKDSKRIKSLKLRNIKLILGGKTRFESLKNAIENIDSSKYDILMVHDAARPLVPKDLMLKLLVQEVLVSMKLTYTIIILNLEKHGQRQE